MTIVAIIGVAALVALVAVGLEFARADGRAASRLAAAAGPTKRALAPAGPSPAATSPTATEASPAGPAVDQCLVGQWRITEDRVEVVLADFGRVSYAGGAGGTMIFDAGGTATVDYGNATSYRATVGEERIDLRVKGQVRFEYEAADGVGVTGAPVSSATFRVYVPGEQPTRPQDWPVNEEPWAYRCSATRLVLIPPDGVSYDFQTNLVRVD